MNQFVYACFFIIASAFGYNVTASDYPYYGQCDERWGNDLMITSTICEEGCAMTCIAMGLEYYNIDAPEIKTDEETMNPMILNKWLVNHNGYDAQCLTNDCNNLKLESLENLSHRISYKGELTIGKDLSTDDLNKMVISKNMIILGHVNNNHHFVLLKDNFNGEGYYVNDPNDSSKTVYTYDEITDVIVYSITDETLNSRASLSTSINYPRFIQCDSQWGGDYMGLENDKTICQVGCLMSSFSMALAGFGIDVAIVPDSQPNSTVTTTFGMTHNGKIGATPKSVNAFLRVNNGYLQGSNNLDEGMACHIDPEHIIWPSDGMHRTPDLSPSTIREYLNSNPPRVVIANVNNGGHFVLVTDILDDDDTLVVNNSAQGAHGSPTYSLSVDGEVVGYRIYDMKFPTKN